MPYSNEDATYAYIRKLMALLFLPEQEIQPMFERPSVHAQTEPLVQLVEYVQHQWIDNAMFPPKDWSIFRQPIRSINDIEGWHNALNRHANHRVHLPFYSLIELLHREAKLACINIRLVSNKKLKRIQRKKYRLLQAKVFANWEQYDTREKSASQLLKSCSRLNGPARMK